MKLNRTAALVFVLALGGVTCLQGQGQDALADSPYYPLKVGTKWNYKVKGQTVTVTMQVAKHEKVDSKMCALIETVVNNNVIGSEHVRVEKDGVYRYTFMGQKAEPPVMFLKLPPKKGDSWKVETKVMGQVAKGSFMLDEDPQVQVPQGKHKAVVARSTDFEAAGQKLSTTYWFAEGIGMIKQQANIAGMDVVLELDKFEAPQ